MNIEQLKAEVTRVQLEQAEKVREAAEIARLQATLRLETNPALFDARVKLATAAAQTAKLQDLVNECAAIIASVPIFNTKARENRRWSGSHRYGYGTQLDLMYQLCTGILYACAEHKQVLLLHTKLDMETIEQFVKSMGAPSYYSRNDHAVVEEKSPNLSMIHATLQVLQSQLGVTIDVSEITQEALQLEFVRASNTAYKQHQQAMEAIAEAHLEM
jgi:hypothetical protein